MATEEHFFSLWTWKRHPKGNWERIHVYDGFRQFFAFPWAQMRNYESKGIIERYYKYSQDS